jgi:hypothetical protein
MIQIAARPGEPLLLQRKKGLRRLENGTFTNYDCKTAEERAEAASYDSKREEAEDTTLSSIVTALD